MNTISNANWVSRIVLMIRLFFWTFWEKIFKILQIIERSHSQLSRLICPIFTDLNIFLVVPLTVEPVFPEQTKMRVYLVIAMAVRVLENMWTQFTFFSFKVQWVCFFVGFAAPPKLTIVFRFVRSITFNVLQSLDSTRHDSMSLFPTIFTLRNIGVHVSTSNDSDIPSYIKVLINEAFSLTPTLNIPDVNPNDRHNWIRRNFDNLWVWGKNNIIENLILLDNLLYIARREVFLRFVMGEIRDAYYFQIGLRLRESRNFYIKEINIINVFDIIFNDV